MHEYTRLAIEATVIAVAGIALMFLIGYIVHGWPVHLRDAYAPTDSTTLPVT